MTKAVIVQMTMVSTKTSKMPHRPCATGSLVFEAAWAMGAEPRPASLEKTPRAMPIWIALAMVKPVAPPSADCGLNAASTTSASMGSSWPALRTRMTRESRT